MQAQEAAKYYKDQCAQNMQHPVLDRVRQCSMYPESAAAFFGRLFWPWENRAGAASILQSFYLRDTRHAMQRDRQQANMQTGTYQLAGAYLNQASCYVVCCMASAYKSTT